MKRAGLARLAGRPAIARHVRARSDDQRGQVRRTLQRHRPRADHLAAEPRSQAGDRVRHDLRGAGWR